MKRFIAFLLLSFLFLQSMIAQNDLNRSVSKVSFGTMASAPDVPAGPYYGASSQGNAIQNAVFDLWFGDSNPAMPNFATLFTDGSGVPEKSAATTLTWFGETSTDWGNPVNWSPNAVPTENDAVVIPSGTTFNPKLTATAKAFTVSIAVGATLDGTAAGASLTIFGGTGAWRNTGTFLPGTSMVTFSNVNASMGGSTDFYNITIGPSGNSLTLEAGNNMRIAGSITNAGILHATTNANIIEYNGTTNQTVIKPNGSPFGYSSLKLSGNRVKTMPSAALTIYGDLTVAGTDTVNALGQITVVGNVLLSSGTTVNFGSYQHYIGGNWTDNGATNDFPAGSTLTFNGSLLQTITTTGGFSIYNLNVFNTGGGVKLGTSTNCTLGGHLLIGYNASLDLDTHQLISIGTDLINLGRLSTKSTSVTPIPSGRTWGGTVEYAADGVTSQTVVSGTYETLSMVGAAGAIATGDITVTGTLALTHNNPSDILGILDMGVHTLTMGPSAETTGTGDMTGIVKRDDISPNVTYSMGNMFTSVTFPNVGTLPSSMSLKISIGGTELVAGAVLRKYDLIQTGGTGTKAVLVLHYLHSELNGNFENRLVDWSIPGAGGSSTELGRSNYNTVDNWIELANLNIADFTSSFNDKYLYLNTSGHSPVIWNGSVSTDWNDGNNWSPSHVPPTSGIDVIIPDATTTDHDPLLPNGAACQNLTLENLSVLNASPSSSDSIFGSWVNQGGTFNAGTSNTIHFEGEYALTYGYGTTNFFNVMVDSTAGLTLMEGAVIKIAGALTLIPAGVFSPAGTLDAALFSNTVEYNGNGSTQTIVNPNGVSAGYYNLVLSGTATKTMPSSLSIYGDLTTNAPFTTPYTGTLLMSGTTAQTISGTSPPAFDNLSVTNANSVTLNVNADVNSNLTVNTNGQVIINPTKNLTVHGTTNLSSGDSLLVLRSNASGTASFIDNGFSGTGTAKVERYLTNTGSGSEWHLVSSPISNGLTGIFVTEYLTQYNEPLHKAEYIIPTYLPLAPMKGYDVWVNNTCTKSFSGTLNTGTQSYNVTRSWMDSVSAYDGWNIVGNPYPSGLDASLLTYSGVETAAYFWNPTGSGNFRVWVPGGGETHSKYVPPMQGFYVHCNSATNASPIQNTGSVGFSNAARTHTLSEPFWKSTETTPDLLRITATGTLNGYSDELSVYFNPERNDTYEPGFDAYKMQGNADAPQIYTKIEDQRVTVNALSFTGRNAAVPMGFYINTAGQYLLHASEIESFPQNVSISLEDLKLGTTQDLRTSADYSFTYTPGDNPDRFVLHFVNPTFGIDEVQNSVPVKIYSNEGIVYVQQLDGKTLAGEIYLYDMLGRETMQMHVDKEGITSFKPEVTKGTYLVKVVTSDGVYTKKVNL